MSEISASLVKTLREKTGAGMMDCKKALGEVNGDLEQAIDWLRKKGLAAAAKKAGRTASDGLVGIYDSGCRAAVIEVNAETDFVGRNPEFQEFVKNLAALTCEKDLSLEQLLTTTLPSAGTSVQEEITRLISVIGENLQVRRFTKLSVSKGHVATYMHNAIVPGLGKIGVLVALESEADCNALADLGKKIAMHIAAAGPQALTIDEVDPQNLEREKNILIDQARASGRPEDVIQKMVEGRLRKYYEEIVLLEQAFVMDGKTKIQEFINQASKDLGKPVVVKSFARFSLGEGIEKEVVDFAAEVKAQASQSSHS